MSEKVFHPFSGNIKGELHIPGDKSISHRAIMLGSLAKGTTVIDNFLNGEDCLHTIEAFKNLGVSIEQTDTRVTIKSAGYQKFTESKVPLYFGNSGTTARLMLGILSALPFHSIVYGDKYLTVRPMSRVTTPLRKMDAQIDGREKGEYLPLAIRGQRLKGITYELPVKSAQVKSAILLAGLFADGKTTVIEKTKTRDHTENIVRAFGAHINVDENSISITNKNGLNATDVYVPGDISSAAFFIVAAAIVPNSKLALKNVGLNKTRSGILDVMKQMGASINIDNEREVSGERIGNLAIRYRPLKGITISGEIIPRLIDEIPIIALLATQAEGKTVIKDAEELRVKETDRIKAVVDTLTTLGAHVEEKPDGMIIHGKKELKGGSILSYGDHRMAMMGIIASLITKKNVTIDDISSIAISYPNFLNDLQSIMEN